MSNPWDNDPIVAAPSADAPWLNDPVVRSAVPGVPVRMPNTTPTPAPSITDKIRTGIGAGLNLAADTVDGLTGMAGNAVGLLGGLAGALGVKLRGGVQPDDPRVVAAGTGPVQGADARPLASGGAGTGEAPVPQTAIDEAGQQTAASAVGAVHQAAGLAGNAMDPLGLAGKAQSAVMTPAARDAADAIEAPGGAMSKIDPQIVMTMHAPGVSADAATVVRGARNTAARAGAAVSESAGQAATSVAKAVVKTDPEIMKTAAIAADKFPDIQIPPDRLSLPGDSTLATAARETGDLPGAGGDAHELANRTAISKYAIQLVNPDDTAGRLTPGALNTGLDRAGAAIRNAYTEAGPLDVSSLDAEKLKDIAKGGSDEAKRVVADQVDQLLENTDADGQISPEAAHNWDSRLGHEIRGTTDSSLARRMSDLQSAVRDQVESRLSPDAQDALNTARRQYAYGVELEPVARSTGTINSGIINDPGQILKAVTDNRSGKQFTARGKGGDLGDLAKVADLVKAPAGPAEGAAAILHAGAKAAGGATVLGPILGRAYNKVGPKATRMLTPKVEAPAAPEAAAPAKPLMLGYEPKLSPDAIPVTPEGQAVTPDTAQAREDLQTSQRVAQGQGGTGAPPRATTFADYDLNAPEFQPPQTTVPAATAPSDLRAVDQQNFARAPSALENAVPEPSFPHDIAEPDTAKVMVSGRPGETAATDIANAAMHEPGAVAARAAQEGAAKSASETAAAKSAAEEAAKPKPTPVEQARLDEIDKTVAGTQSDIVRDTLEKERARVMKDVAARDTLEKTKAAADELRTAAASITDPATKKAMLAKADRLDPPKPGPKAKPDETPLPSIEYADTPEWRKAHGLGPEDAQRAILTRQAADIDLDAVEAAAVQHANSPRAFDRVIDQILEKHHANEATPATQGSQKPEAGSGKSAGATQPAVQQRGPDGVGAPPADEQGHLASGSTEPGLEDPHAEAARLAKFHLDHPRAADGTFTEKE